MNKWVVFEIKGRARGSKTVPMNDKSAIKWVVRWRLNDVDKKRTFPTKGHAKTFREILMRASVMSWDADERGRPIDPARPTNPVAALPERSGPSSRAGMATHASGLNSLSGVLTLFDGSARTFESYCDAEWWPTMSPTFGDKNMIGHRRNMETAKELLVYREDDPRCAYPAAHPAAHPAARPGGSILLHHLSADDLLRAVVARRSINGRAAAVNGRRLAAQLAAGHSDITLLSTEASPATVRYFYVTISMIVKAAMRSGHINGDPLAGVSRLAPKPKPKRVVNRLVPSIGDVFDLADAMSVLGPVENGRPRGDRFHALVLAAGTLGPRPGELVAHRPELIKFGSGQEPTTVTFAETEAAVYDTATDLRGRRTMNLKHRQAGECREVPALPEVADALRVHLERGYAGHGRTFTSATGRGRLDWGNITDAYWRPACERVFAGTAKAALAQMPPKTLRKAAITHWLHSGIDIYMASDLAGHSTDVAALYYAGRSDTTYSREVDLLGRSLRRR